jgi:hypothetical protein
MDVTYIFTRIYDKCAQIQLGQFWYLHAEYISSRITLIDLLTMVYNTRALPDATQLDPKPRTVIHWTEYRK